MSQKLDPMSTHLPVLKERVRRYLKRECPAMYAHLVQSGNLEKVIEGHARRTQDLTMKLAVDGLNPLQAYVQAVEEAPLFPPAERDLAALEEEESLDPPEERDVPPPPSRGPSEATAPGPS